MDAIQIKKLREFQKEKIRDLERELAVTEFKVAELKGKIRLEK